MLKNILNNYCADIDEYKKKKVFFIPLNGAENFKNVLIKNQILLNSNIPVLKILNGDKNEEQYTKKKKIKLFIV
ncbi:hypothetical protein [Mesoplasma melaleucae]|uniref:hypothetical protein n=1 Tax=Mesoplasma melaleucae TaxID=81459 RepID=UPI0012EB7723|nr:hypothetical protein [Mesoplasma melaleucae]